jgi:hypothetical protein
MKISTNNLFHFTPNITSLKSILKKGFYVRYSLENYGDIFDKENEVLIPMVCFCDIPLSLVSDHTKTYGKFGIGLSKEWGINNKISPVIYTNENSIIANLFNKLHDHLNNYIDIDDSQDMDNSKTNFLSKLYELSANYKIPVIEDLTDQASDMTDAISHIVQNIKPYKGKIMRNTEYRDNIRFYDEREWRFLLPKNFFTENKIKGNYNKEFYTNPIKKRYANIKIATHFRLTFEPKDVKFIIVEEDSQVPEILKFLDETFGSQVGVSSNDLKLLGTRIISLEHIIENL